MARLRPDVARADLEYLWDQFGASWAVNGQVNVAAYQSSTDFLYEQGTFGNEPRIAATDWVEAYARAWRAGWTPSNSRFGRWAANLGTAS